MVELIQINGCDRAWFEDRGPKCTLLVYVDDATSRLMEIRFVASESIFDDIRIDEGLPRAPREVRGILQRQSQCLSCDQLWGAQGGGPTQFSRALSELNIDIVCANSPQAKGRVERAHLTFQGQFIKELWLCNISTPEAANAHAPELIVDYKDRLIRSSRS